MILVGDDLVRTRLGHDTMLTGWRRWKAQRAHAKAAALAAQLDPERRGLVLRTQGH